MVGSDDPFPFLGVIKRPMFKGKLASFRESYILQRFSKVRFACSVVGKNEKIFLPNAGLLMMIYHGRITN